MVFLEKYGGLTVEEIPRPAWWTLESAMNVVGSQLEPIVGEQPGFTNAETEALRPRKLRVQRQREVTLAQIAASNM